MRLVMTKITVILFFLNLTCCIHHSRNSSIRPMKNIKIRIFDAITKNPIDESLVFIVEKGYDKPDQGICRISKKVNENGLFQFQTKSAPGTLDFCIESFAYSVPQNR
ncbi:hypothetical protein JXQ70_13800 [bacterium]|nr:hypothetical protein [bacterium]